MTRKLLKGTVMQLTGGELCPAIRLMSVEPPRGCGGEGRRIPL